MQQNCSFTSNLSEVSEPESYSKNYSSVVMFGLLVLGSAGVGLIYPQQQVQATESSFVNNQPLSNQPINLTNSNNLQSTASTQIPLKTEIVELPKLSFQPTTISSTKLSSTVVTPFSPQHLNVQGKLKQKQLDANLGQQLKAQSVNQTPQTDLPPINQITQLSPQEINNSQPQSQTQTTVVIVSNLDKNSRSIPQLPALKLQKNISKQIYTVKPGDTLAKIARSYNISSKQLIQTNQLHNPNLLSINQQLTIPIEETTESTHNNSNLSSLNSSNSTPQTISNSSVSQAVTSIPTTKATNFQPNNLSTNENPYLDRLRADLVQLREQYQNQTNSTPATYVSQPQGNFISTGPTNANNYNQTLKIEIGATINPPLPPLSSPDQYLPDSPIEFNGYLWPAQGTLTSGYGIRWGRMHRGIDIAAPIGTPIIAAASGEVISAGWNSGGYGNLVKLKHPDGSITMYAHNNKVLVSSGQEVKQGQLIAEMGTTGYSTGPHLHFEIRPNGETAVNPIAYLPSK